MSAVDNALTTIFLVTPFVAPRLVSPSGRFAGRDKGTNATILLGQLFEIEIIKPRRSLPARSRPGPKPFIRHGPAQNGCQLAHAYPPQAYARLATFLSVLRMAPACFPHSARLSVSHACCQRRHAVVVIRSRPARQSLHATNSEMREFRIQRLGGRNISAPIGCFTFDEYFVEIA